MAATTAKWTLEAYHRMVEAGMLEGRAVELLHGEIVEMSPEGAPHAAASSDAGESLANLLGDRAQVRQSKPITLPALVSEPEPDLAIVRRLGRSYRHRHPNPDDVFWLAEYAQSSLNKDWTKRNGSAPMLALPSIGSSTCETRPCWFSVNRLMAPIGSSRC